MEAFYNLFSIFGGSEFAAVIPPDPAKYGYVNGKEYNGKYYARGDEFGQLFTEYPFMSGFYTEFEKTYNPEPVLNWMKNNNYMVPIIAVVLYVLFVFVVGPYYMKNRDAMKLKYEAAAWNLFLSIFSFWGISRTVPHLLWRISTQSFEDTVCIAPHVGYGSGVCGLATQMFVISKIPELFDTVLLVLKKKEVIFLHWYHHITVLLYCWNSYVTESSAGLYFIAMNYTVHAFMYLYFCLVTLHLVPTWFNRMWLTGMQISQMVVGVSVVSACIYYHMYGTQEYTYKLSTSKCNNLQSNLIAGGLMYTSYLYLFVEFAIKKFFFGIDDYVKPRTESIEAVKNYGSAVDLAAESKKKK